LKDYPELAAKPVEELIANLSAVPEAIRGPVRIMPAGTRTIPFSGRSLVRVPVERRQASWPKQSILLLAGLDQFKENFKRLARADSAAAGRGSLSTRRANWK